MCERALLQAYGIRPSKGLGQHFLVDRRVLNKILAAADLDTDDLVLEIGPGAGVLTRALAERAGHVIAVELDQRLVALLAETLADQSDIRIVHGDILKTDLGQLLASEWTDGQRPEFKLVANLPYYITSAVLRHVLEAEIKPQLIVVTVQREVAERIVARPGAMSLLSVSVQFFGSPHIVGRIPPSAFYPRPKVHSAVVRIEVYDSPRPPVADVATFFNIVRAGFAHRRKQLRNTLSHELRLATPEIAAALSQAGIDPRRRAQSLSLEEWGQVYHALMPLLSGNGWTS